MLSLIFKNGQCFKLTGQLQVTYWTIFDLSRNDSIKITKDDVPHMYWVVVSTNCMLFTYK